MNRINKKVNKNQLNNKNQKVAANKRNKEMQKINRNKRKTKESYSKENIKKRKKKKSKFKIILCMVLLMILLLGISFGVKVYQNGGGLQGLLSTFLGQSPEKLQDLDTIYVLVMGVSEDLGAKLTDTIILCAYNPKQQTASMLSIPRDTFVGNSKTNAKGTDKINSLYASSPQKLLKTVSEMTGINVKYYAVVNTSALTKIVDIIGGVQFNVPMNMKYDDKTQNLHINLKAGMQNINGEEAEQLLRFRHSNPDKNGNMTTYPAEYGSDDYGRMKTQRDFITETIKQTLSLKNITKINELIRTVFDNIETNLTIDEILPYVPYTVNFNTENIDSEQLPGLSDKYNEIWFFIYDKQETETMITQMINQLEGIDPVEENTTLVNETNITNTVTSNKRKVTETVK